MYLMQSPVYRLSAALIGRAPGEDSSNGIPHQLIFWGMLLPAVYLVHRFVECKFKVAEGREHRHAKPLKMRHFALGN